jgi:hypothetical protein
VRACVHACCDANALRAVCKAASAHTGALQRLDAAAARGNACFLLLSGGATDRDIQIEVGHVFWEEKALSTDQDADKAVRKAFSLCRPHNLHHVFPLEHQTHHSQPRSSIHAQQDMPLAPPTHTCTRGSAQPPAITSQPLPAHVSEDCGGDACLHVLSAEQS